MRRVVALLVPLLLLAPLAAHARDRDPFSFSEDGVLPSGWSYSLRIEERPFVPRPGEAEDDGSRWGIDGGFPGT